MAWRPPGPYARQTRTGGGDLKCMGGQYWTDEKGAALLTLP